MKKQNNRSTLLLLVTAGIVLYFIFHHVWYLYLAVIVGCAGIFSPYLSKKIVWFWSGLTHILSLIVPPLILTIVFYCFLFPIALLARLSKKDPLMLNKSYGSYFVTRQKTTATDFEKSW